MSSMIVNKFLAIWQNMWVGLESKFILRILTFQGIWWDNCKSYFLSLLSTNHYTLKWYVSESFFVKFCTSILDSQSQMSLNICFYILNQGHIHYTLFYRLSMLIFLYNVSIYCDNILNSVNKNFAKISSSNLPWKL